MLSNKIMQSISGFTHLHWISQMLEIDDFVWTPIQVTSA